MAAAARAVLYALVFLPAAFGFVYVALYGVNVPYFDTWTMVPLFEKLHEGQLTLSDLFEQFNEHRILVPRIVVLLLGSATAFNDVAVMYLTQISLLATLVVLLLAFRRTVSRSPLLFLPVPFLIFSLGQSWNMLQSFQIALVFAQTFGVLAFYLLYLCRDRRGRWPACSGAVGSGIIASFSAAPGILVWPVGLVQLLLLPIDKATKTRLAGAWGISGAVGLSLYFVGYETSGGRSSLYVLDHPLEAAEFLARMLGGSLFWQKNLESWQENIPYVTGIFLTCLALMGSLSVLRRQRLGECSFWMALVLFSFLVLAATALARGAGEEALNPKYVTYSVLAVAGVYAILVRLLSENRTPLISTPLVTLTALVAASIPVSYIGGVERGEDNRTNKEEAAFVLATHETQPDDVLQRLLRPNPDARRELISTLEALEYSVFSSPRPRVLPPPLSELSPARPEERLRVGLQLAAENPDGPWMQGRRIKREVFTSP